GFLDQVDIYNSLNDSWTTATLSQPRYFLTATTVGHLALFAGGAGSGPSNLVDIYNSQDDTWTTATLSQTRYDLAATTVGNLALFAGGYAYSDQVDIFSHCTPSCPLNDCITNSSCQNSLCVYTFQPASTVCVDVC